LFAGYHRAFKPAAIDFGPEAGEILEPEDAKTFELGVKGVNASDHLTWEVSAIT
jgi:hypothetical protein